jgi:hypothetical protein
MNCKLLAIWTSVILILWILLFYIVNMEKINKMKEDFANANANTSGGVCTGKTPIDSGDCVDHGTKASCISQKDWVGIAQCNWAAANTNANANTNTSNGTCNYQNWPHDQSKCESRTTQDTCELDTEMDPIMDNKTMCKWEAITTANANVANVNGYNNVYESGSFANNTVYESGSSANNTVYESGSPESGSPESGSPANNSAYKNESPESGSPANNSAYKNESPESGSPANNSAYKNESPKNTLNTHLLNYQIGELTKNYESIDELDGQLETNTRKLNLLNQQTNELNRVAYVFKYITIISISLLILMICIFILNFDHISGPSAMARSKASALFKRLKATKPKRII